jgi:SAM-dependent methyltransferase
MRAARRTEEPRQMLARGYVFDTAERLERERLETQSSVRDPFTRRSLDDVGVATGWRCLDIGAGTGSVAAWLHERVGSAGHVLATDLETRWLQPLEAPNLEIRRHDIVSEPLEASHYDLVHARLVLMHLPQRAAVLEKLVAASRPGGWLVLEDYDVPSPSSSNHQIQGTPDLVTAGAWYHVIWHRAGLEGLDVLAVGTRGLGEVPGSLPERTGERRTNGSRSGRIRNGRAQPHAVRLRGDVRQHVHVHDFSRSWSKWA